MLSGYYVAYFRVIGCGSNQDADSRALANPYSKPTLEFGLLPEGMSAQAMEKLPEGEHVFTLPAGAKIIRLQPGDPWPNMAPPPQRKETPEEYRERMGLPDLRLDPRCQRLLADGAVDADSEPD